MLLYIVESIISSPEAHKYHIKNQSSNKWASYSDSSYQVKSGGGGGRQEKEKFAYLFRRKAKLFVCYGSVWST